MSALLTAGLLSGAGSVLGGLFGMGSQSSANTANMELAKYQFEKNKEMWDLQNVYNSPVKQMERLKAAGLNPNLVYGNGAVGNTTSGAPQMERPNIEPLSNGGFVSDAVQRSLFTGAQIDNLRQQTELSKSQQKVQEANITRIGQEVAESIQRTARSKFDLILAQELKQNSIDVANANLESIKSSTKWRNVSTAMEKARLEMIPLERSLKATQISQINASLQNVLWDLEMKKEGLIPSNDPLSWVVNQLIRMKNGQPNAFDGISLNPADVNTLIRGSSEDSDIPWWQSKKSYYKSHSKGSGVR